MNCDAAVEIVRRSGMDQCYLRPILFRSLDEAIPFRSQSV